MDRHRVDAAHSSEATIWRRRDPNYPGVPQPPAEPEVMSRSFSTKTVSYETYVLDYGARQRNNLLLAGVGGMFVILALAFLNDPWRGIGGALGAIGVLAGMGSLWLTADAHARYIDVATSVSETYAPPAPSATVRAFVPSADAPATVLSGRFSLPVATWTALFETAAVNGGKLTRDAATKVLPRPLYRDWQETVGELQRLGLIDAESRPTAAAWALVGRRSPFPNDDESLAPAQSTHARRTHGAHGAEQGDRGRGA